MQQTRVVQSSFNYTCSPITLALYIEWPVDTAPAKINWCQILPGT